MKLLYDKASASDALSISQSTLNRLIRDQRIGGVVNLGGRVLIKAEGLKVFAKSLTDRGGAIGEEPKKPRGRPRLAI